MRNWVSFGTVPLLDQDGVAWLGEIAGIDARIDPPAYGSGDIASAFTEVAAVSPLLPSERAAMKRLRQDDLRRERERLNARRRANRVREQTPDADSMIRLCALNGHAVVTTRTAKHEAVVCPLDGVLWVTWLE